MLRRYTHLCSLLPCALPQQLKWTPRLPLWKQDLWRQFNLWLLLISCLKLWLQLCWHSLFLMWKSSLWLSEIHSIFILFPRQLSIQAALGAFHSVHMDTSLYIFTSFVIPFVISTSKWYIHLVHWKVGRKRQRNN